MAIELTSSGQSITGGLPDCPESFKIYSQGACDREHRDQLDAIRSTQGANRGLIPLRVSFQRGSNDADDN